MSTFDQVKREIDRLDPYHLLEMHAPQDEYDAESRKISERISYADVMQTAFGEPDSPARFPDTAVRIRRALCCEYYGGMSDQFEYGNLSDAECIPLANEIIRQTRTETDSVILEMIWNAVHVLITNRNVADQLDLLPLTENPLRFDAQSAEYLPDILAAADAPQYKEIIRHICEQYPQTGLPSADI